MKRNVFLILLVAILFPHFIYAQEESYVPDVDESEFSIADYYLPDYQIGASFELNKPRGFMSQYMDRTAYGFGLNFYGRIGVNNPLLLGFEYHYAAYDKSLIKASSLAGYANSVQVSPRINDFLLSAKYEIFPFYYFIPYVKAGVGGRYYHTSLSERDPYNSSEYMTYSETKNMRFMGEVGAGLAIAVLSPVLIEVGVNYSHTTRMKYDYLPKDLVQGVQDHPLDFYEFNKSTMGFLFFDFRLIIELYE